MATTSISNELPAWYQNHLATLAGRGQQLAQMPFAPYTQPRVAGFSPEQEAGMRMAATRATAGSPLLQDAQQQLRQTIGGQYLADGNPYLQGMIDRTMNDVRGNLTPMVQGSGSFGNTAVQQTIARQMADAANAMRYQNYGDERARQMQSMLFAPTMAGADYADADALMRIGGMRQGLNQQVADVNFNEFQRAQQWPFQTTQAYGQTLGFNPGSTQTQNAPDPSRAGQVLGGGLLGYGLGSMIPGNTFGISNSLLGAGLGGLLGAFF